MDYLEWILNEENGWDYDVEGDALQGRVVCVGRKKVLQKLDEMKIGIAPRLSEV